MSRHLSFHFLVVTTHLQAPESIFTFICFHVNDRANSDECPSVKHSFVRKAAMDRRFSHNYRECLRSVFLKAGWVPACAQGCRMTPTKSGYVLRQCEATHPRPHSQAPPHAVGTGCQSPPACHHRTLQATLCKAFHTSEIRIWQQTEDVLLLYHFK